MGASCLYSARNHWSDFEISSQESGFDVSRCPDCPIAVTICEPAGQVKFLVCYPQYGSLLQIPVVFGL